MTPRQQRAQERAASRARIEAAHAETLAIVKAGRCPLCGSKIKRNYSLTGWWQCEQYGTPQFRARPHDSPCSWQGFIE